MNYLRRLAPLLVFQATFLLVGVAGAVSYRVEDGSISKEKRVLTAGPEGARLTLPRGVQIQLSAGAALLSHRESKLWLDNKGRTRTLIFSLREGRADVTVPDVERHLRTAVLMQTSRKLSGAVSSGKMTVLADSQYGAIANYGGVVISSDGGRWNPVLKNHVAAVTRHRPKVKQTALPVAPELKFPRRLWMALGGPVDLGEFAWKGISGAATYQWKLSVNGKTAHKGTSLEPVVRNGSLAVGPGTYELSVAAVDGFGLSGEFSKPAPLTVVGVRAEDGSRVDEQGIVHVDSKQRATFSNVEGLLMAYGMSQRWSPAVRRVPIFNSKRTTVHFRHPQSSEIVSARLQPRTVSARVRVGSKNEQWPGDAVLLTVQLKDGVGGAQLREVKPKVVVKLGLEEIPVAWRRIGNTLQAKLAPRPGPGPWVVRAAVYDQFGTELGRDFLEITEHPEARRQRFARRTGGAEASAGGAQAAARR